MVRPPRSVSSVRVSLTTRTAQRTVCGDDSRCFRGVESIAGSTVGRWPVMSESDTRSPGSVDLSIVATRGGRFVYWMMKVAAPFRSDATPGFASREPSRRFGHGAVPHHVAGEGPFPLPAVCDGVNGCCQASCVLFAVTRRQVAPVLPAPGFCLR